jgi:hypothetical protein
MRNGFIIFCVIVFGFELKAQTVAENVPGQVSFISPQNVYVKFKSTDGILAGDTLFTPSGGNLIPVFKVNNLSSTSCACTSLSDASHAVGDLVIARVKKIPAKPEEKPVEKVAVQPPPKIVPEVPVKKPADANEPKQKIRGSISAYSYSDFSNTTAKNSQRFRYTLSLDAKNIGNSKFSVESYISFRHKMGEWGDVKANVFNALKIYSLSVKYDLNKTTQVSLGRKINPRISSIGAMDGLQFEKTLNKFAMGAVVGSRPDYTNYGFDLKLFQYGAYVAYNTKSADNFSESSLAFMQQTNNSKTDRRFLYLQHSNSIIKNIYFFSTFEIDLYKLKNNKPQNTFNPTGLYLSLRYKMSNSLTFSGSYDARKNIMYYESYKTSIDSILEKEIRQGFRIQGNYRITRDIMFGLQGGYRFLKSDPHPSKNLYSYLTYSQIPGIKMSATISATYLESNYLNGKILGVSLTKDLFEGKVQTGLGYRYIDYLMPENQLTIKQNIAEFNFSWQVYKNISMSVNYEGTFEQKNRYNRVYFQVRKRF